MPEHRRGSLVGPVLLIAFGALFLYSNFRTDFDPWWLLTRYWPLLLVFLGVGKLWDYYRQRNSPEQAQRRWLGGGEIAIIVLVLVVGAAITFRHGHGRFIWGGHHIHDVQSVDLPGIESAQVRVEMPAGYLKLSAGADKLLEGTFDYDESNGKPTFSHEIHGKQGQVTLTQEDSHIHFLRHGGNNWILGLNKNLPMELKIDMGAGRGDFQLSGLSLTKLDIQVGAGQIMVDLTGDWKKNLDARIEGGVGQAIIRLPETVGVRVHATSGIGSIRAPDLQRQDDYYVNSAYGKSPVTLQVEVEKGIGAIQLVSEHRSGHSSEN